ncbi:tRNA (guanosine(37)-N1)-methyltransferase TrmD [Wenzhouxiangella marina]|uniref:tRNA (guanine-N(1)-)-methyltransferase n=1 Tax=Wenzhouxiangella marina TaxID=1579979 RepID=A0A0K0XWE1_9GAMM|nr:tRNA (guanosine(37)-N1)-methyltransferase TrmD [Wenzhouxiangella marina]AKS41998.1 tRNA (guanine-N(1)-)-methyltransferase [Wenzhouxiangella marina]MBB6086234.1 tRNA (guanine37-N1)-methyltransferase [Wenzhouxiangella marina]
MSLSRIDVISLFPEWIEGLKQLGLTGRALTDGRIELQTWNPRDYASGVHRSVDDRPFGGGPGMVMRPEPLAQAIEAAKSASPSASVVYLSPQGRALDDAGTLELAERPALILVCGRYEGVDQRLIDSLVDEEWSVGDYVLSGGEPAAAILIDAVTRRLPGVLGHSESAVQDSFATGLLDCPHYTRPEHWRDRSVPEVLLSGDHARIDRWRRAQALHRTARLRPDLFRLHELGKEDLRALEEFPEEFLP